MTREVIVTQTPLPEPPTFYVFGADLPNEPMERWVRQLNEYAQAVSVALERIVKRP